MIGKLERLRPRTRAGRISTSTVVVTIAVVLAAGLVGTPAAAAPVTTGIFSGTLAPNVAADADNGAVELGVRFSPQESGQVTALQYYQGSEASGVTSATLWSSTGAVIATSRFTPTDTVGWRTVPLGAPVALTAGDTYVVSYYAPNGSYPLIEGDLTTDRVQNGFTLEAGAGVYRYGSQRSVPTSSYRGSNYLVDVVYLPESDITATPSSTTTSTPTTTTSTPTTTTSTPTTTTSTPTTTTSTPPTTTTSTTPTTTTTTTPTTTSSSDSGTTKCVGAANTPGGSDPWGGCWPGPQNTGYPHGLPGDTRSPVTLTAYTGPTTITECGTVIDSKIVNDDIVVEVGNDTHSPDTPCVTIKNSLVRGVIHTDDASYGPVVVTDTEVAVPGLGWWENVGRYNVFLWRVNSHGSEGVIKCGDYCAVYDSWVHGMRLGGAYHYNAFGGNGMESAAGYFKIQHNWASCGDWESVDPALQSDAGCSASIGFYGDFAPIRNITINRNFIAGATTVPNVPDPSSRQPGYCLNPGYYPGKPYPAPTNVSITDNIFGRGSTGRCGVYGPTNSLSGEGTTNGNTWSNNRYEDGVLIPWPHE